MREINDMEERFWFNIKSKIYCLMKLYEKLTLESDRFIKICAKNIKIEYFSELGIFGLDKYLTYINNRLILTVLVIKMKVLKKASKKILIYFEEILKTFLIIEKH